MMWRKTRTRTGGRAALWFVWLLNLPGQGQVTPPNLHPRLVLCEQDTGDEGRFGFVQIHVAGLFKT